MATLRHPDLISFAAVVERRQIQVTRRVIGGIYNILTGPPPEGTPVKYGVARAGWHVGLNQEIVEVPLRRPRRSRGRISVIRRHAPEELDEPMTINDTLYLTNAVPYIELLNAGSSMQSPAGFVEDAVDRVVHQYESIVKVVVSEDGGE